ncbi:rRNA methyltransferase 2, mitochondrial [Prorops nasuta]|uniref:rRNA methyltransferase 2, mitochondrial n=1 Tax=Prorops nasuta TaxID=863751 RepID=UPI0034CE7740
MHLFMKSVQIRMVHTGHALWKERPKNLKNKKHSSQLWLTRQFRDPYVEKAKQENYRCRSAFKLLEIQERFNIFEPGKTVVDLGAAPGSWSQVAVKYTNSQGRNPEPVGRVIAIDKQPIYRIEGAHILGNMDFTVAKSQEALKQLLDNVKADLVMSDMAPNATGTRELDHDNIIKLSYIAVKFAVQNLKLGGTFLTKIWDGGRSAKLEDDLLKFYETVKIIRPEATRDESSEKFILARGFKGLKA